MLQILAYSFITKPVVFWAMVGAAVLVEIFLIAVVADAVRRAAMRKAAPAEAQNARVPAFIDALSDEHKKYYEEIVARVNETKGVAVNSVVGGEEYRLGKYRVLRFLVKENVLFAQMVTYGKDFQAQVYGGHADAEFSLNVIAVDSASAVKDVKAAYGRVLLSVPNV